MILTNPTDAQLNAAFAEKVAGFFRCDRLGREVFYDPEGGHVFGHELPQFTSSADAVLPWLEKIGWRGTSNRAGSTCAATVQVNDCDCTGLTFTAQVDDRTADVPFSKAAVIALLRAHGVEVEFA